MHDMERVLIAKLRLEGAELDEAGCTPASLCFTYSSVTFFIPRIPPDGFDIQILMHIQDELEFLGIDLLPLDLWMN